MTMRQIDTSAPGAVAALREFLSEAERFDDGPPVSDQALLAVVQGKRALLAFSGAGAHAAEQRIDAYGILGEGELDLVVRPTARGRGVAREALAQMLEAHARGVGGPGGEVRVWAHGQNPSATSLLEHAGFEPVRELLRMTLDPELLDSAVAKARPLPEGFEVRAFDPLRSQPGPAPDDADEWVRVNAAAFADHAEQGSITRADFDGLTREQWFAPEDLRLAFETESGALAGFAWVKTTREQGVTETELYAIGVDPDHLGRGLGAALLGETMRRMRIHEPHRVSLYVDGDNLGALALYERAGFEVEQRSTQWRRSA